MAADKGKYGTDCTNCPSNLMGDCYEDDCPINYRAQDRDMTADEIQALLDGATDRPWAADSLPPCRIWSFESYEVAQCNSVDGGIFLYDAKTACANAKLIAAAPDLARTALADKKRIVELTERLTNYRDGIGGALAMVREYRRDTDEPANSDRAEITVLCERIAKLEAILDGDPNQTETLETRRAWRRSAVKYADKCDTRIADLEKQIETLTTISELKESPEYFEEAARLNFAVLEAERDDARDMTKYWRVEYTKLEATLAAEKGQWEILKVELTNWIQTDEPNSESQEAVRYVRDVLMPKVEVALAEEET